MTLVQNYRRKPEPVEAVKLTSANADEVAAWCGGLVVEDQKSSDPTDIAVSVNFPTLSGVVSLRVGELLVKNKSGVFSKATESIFTQVYEIDEPVTDGSEDPYLPTN